MPSFRAFFAAAFLTFTVALALTLALPGSGAVQAQEDHEEPGAEATEVTPAAATLILSYRDYDSAHFTVSDHVGAWWIKADKGPDSGANVCKAATLSGGGYEYRADGLTHNTTYTYTAYSDNTCATQLGSPITFTTLEKKLVAIVIEQNMAKLQRVGLDLGLLKAYIKGDGAAPHNTCTKFDDVADRNVGGGIEDTLTLTGLDPKTSYTYRAYEDSLCATELSVMTFTTLPAELAVQSLGPNSVSLRLTGHKGRDWYYKANKAPHNNCTEQKGNAPNPINTLNLGGLTISTAYTYTAYTDSNCTDGNELDDDGVTFTTLATAPTLTVSYISPTTAKLTISGYTGIWLFTADSWYQGRCSFTQSNVAYLTDLTPGATYTFKAAARIPGQGCTAEMAAAKPFTTPAQLTECASLSIVEAGVTSSAWKRHVEVKNNTDDAIHNVRVFTYYVSGPVSSVSLDPLSSSAAYEDTIPELQPGATVRNEHTSSNFAALVAELNGVVQLVDPVNRSAVLCETAIEPSWWSYALASRPPANPQYWVSTQLDNPVPGAGENATVSVTAYATTVHQLLQACVNIHFDGLAPVDADDDGNHDVVIYDGPNGKYKEDGTLNSGGFRRAGRLDYDSDGYDEDVASWRYRPQCSDAAGKFQGSLFRIGNTERRTSSAVKWPTPITETRTWPLTYTVKIPVTATGSGSGCLTATVRALPPEVTDNLKTAYEKAQDNTAKVCLGAPPAKDPKDPDPSLPVLFQSGRADLLTVHKCADGVNFPCAGKSAGDLAQYVDGSTLAASGTGDTATGNAAENAGSIYRAFRAEDVVTHVADLTTAAGGGRIVRKHPTSPSKAVWYTGHDLADIANDNNDFGPLPGVAAKYTYLGAAYKPHKWSICDLHRPQYIKDGTGDVCDSTAAEPNPGNIRGIYYRTWSFMLLDEGATQPTRSSTSSSTAPAGVIFEFETLGTHVTEILREETEGSGTIKTVDKYTFHVGPAADLSVRAGGASASVASGKRAFTIVAESEPTPEIDASVTHHGHTDLINLESLRPTVAITANDAAIPAANVSQVGATAGSYDTATGVWTLPDGWQGQATLTLVADAGAVGSVTAAITNSAEVCENDAGAAQTTVDGRAPVDRATCEFDKDGTSSGYHWGAYQRCIKPDATAYGDNPHNATYTSDKDTCEANVTNGTWHTTEWYDWRPHNNTVTFTPDAAGFTLTARGAGRSSIDLLWAKQAGADEYAIYSVSTADLASTDNLGALLGPNQIAVVPADTTAYYHDGLKRGQKRQYLIRARKDGRPFALSNLAGATAQIPGQPWKGPPASQPPGAVGSLKAARKSDDATTINVSWNAPSSGATGYDVQYRSRLGSSGSYGNWTGLSTQQGGTAYTFHNAGGGTSYQFQVRAVNVYGGQTNYSGWSASNTVSPVSNPNQVGSLTATRDSLGTTINVSWDAPSSGTTPTGYQVQYQTRTGNSGSWDAWTPDPATTQTGTTYDLTNATGAKSYQFRVRTVTVTGGDTIYGGWRTSNVVRAFDNPDLVQNLSATRDDTDDTIITVEWDDPSSSVTIPTHYDVQYQQDGGAWQPDPATRQAKATGNEYVPSGVNGNHSYRFRVRAVTVSNDIPILGSWRTSGTVPALTKPGQVGSLQATRKSDDETTINVTWTAPSNATGQTSYKVQYKADNATTWTDAPAAVDPKQTSYTLTGAAGGSQYVFQVRAVTTLTSGTGLEGSWRSSNTVPGLAAGKIETVTAERQTNGVADPDSTTIYVSWTESARATVGYDVEYRKDSGSWQRAATQQSAQSYTYPDADGAEKYTFRVRGVSGAGNGPWAVSAQVDQPPVRYLGADVGVDYVTLKMASGPWWYKFRKNGDWGSCVRVASGDVTITGLWATTRQAAGLYTSSGCSQDRIGGIKSYSTLSDINDWGMCWETDDCRDIDNPNNFNQHTHKRSRLHTLGVNLSDCAFSRELHSHGWPDGGGGQHWHCPN